MTERPTDSLAVAEVLRENPPSPNDIARVRLEQRVLAAAGDRSVVRRPLRVALGAGVVLAAAAAALVFLALDDEPAAPVARFERREASASVERGTLEEGSALRTEPHEVADIQIVDSRVRIESASRLRIARLTSERLALELEDGAVRVAFHPRQRGRERMTVETPNARVEVVGTVFRVEVGGDGTRVAVSEGTVRVVPLDGGPVRLVHAGQRTHVEAAEIARADEEREGLPERLAPESDPSSSDVSEAAPLAVDSFETLVPEDAPAALDEPSGESGEAIEPEPEWERGAEPVDTSDGLEATAARDETGANRVETAANPAEAAPRRSDPAELLSRAVELIQDGHEARALPILRALTRASVPARVRTDAWLRIGDVSEREGRLDQAVRAYRAAEQAGRGHSQAHNAIFSLARLQERRLHDVEAARVSYERYLREAPQGALAYQARVALCRLGRTEHCAAR